MASISIVEYLLKLGGNLPAGAKDAAAAVDRLEKSADRAKMGIEKLGRMAGGPLGEITNLAGDASDVIEALGASAGGMGIAVGGAAVAVVGLAAGSKALADAAVLAAARLDDQGRASEIPPEALSSLRAYEAAGKDLRAEIDLLTVSIGAELAGGLTDVARIMGDLVRVWRDGAAQAAAFTDSARGVMRALTAFGSLGLSELALGALESGRPPAPATWQGPPLPPGMGPMGVPGQSGPGRAPRAASGSASGLITDAQAMEIIREGNMAAESAAGDARRAAAASQANTAATEASTRAAEAVAQATDELTGQMVSARSESAAQTRGIVAGLISFGTDLATLPSQINDFVRSLPELTTGFVKDFESVLSAWPDAAEQLLTDLPGVLIESAPKMAIAFVTMGPRLAISMVDAFADGIKDLFSVDFWRDAGRSLAESIGAALNDLVNPFNAGGKIGTDLTPAKGEKARFLGIKLPSFDSAMRQPMEITRTGLATVHAGEVIGGKGAGGRSLVVNVNVGTAIGAGAGVELARVIRRELGSYGLGGSVTPAYP